MSHWIFGLWSQVYIVVYFGIWLTLLYTTTTNSGFLYVRKKLDHAVDTPAGSNSIWTARMFLFVVGIFALWDLGRS